MTLLAFARRVDVMSLLILGLMISYGVGAIVSILIFYSMADRLQSFFNWSFGNFSSVTWTHFLVFAPSVVVGLAAVVPQIKSLDAFLLGERYASSMGVNVRRSRILILGSDRSWREWLLDSVGRLALSGLLPRIFVGFSLGPHPIEYSFLLRSCLEASLLLIVDLIAKAPGIEATLPLNAVTALIGAPVVVAALLKQRNLRRVFGG